MTIDNNKDFIQFCNKLSKIIHQLLNISDRFLSSIEDSIEVYQQISQEGAAEFYNKRFSLHDSVDLLCDLWTTNISDNKEFYNSVVILRDTALDVATYLVSANAMIKEIITIYLERYKDEVSIHLYRAMLKLISCRIHYMHEGLERLYNDASQSCPDLIVPKEDTDMELESILPGEVASFQSLRRILDISFAEYANCHGSEHITEYFIAIQQYLESFANGVQADEEFCFDFALRKKNEMEYIHFNFEPEMIEVSSGGSVYDSSVGSDNYTSWEYRIWLDGCENHNNNYRFLVILELVRAGAELSIESPEEYIIYEE